MILKAIAGKLESWEAARIIGVTERTVRREKYFDFNVQHLHEILLNEHGLKYRYTWAKKAFRMRAWWKGARSRAATASGVHGGPCQE